MVPVRTEISCNYKEFSFYRDGNSFFFPSDSVDSFLAFDFVLQTLDGRNPALSVDAPSLTASLLDIVSSAMSTVTNNT